MSYNNATMPISLTSYKKLNPDGKFIAIKLYPISKEINSINNSAQCFANNVNLNNSGLSSEKKIISAKPNLSAFLQEHLLNTFNTKKNAENALQQAKLQSENLYSVPFDVIREKEPIYHVPNDDIAKQQSVNYAAHYSVIGAELNNDEVYSYPQEYATVGEEVHIYDEIDYATIGEKEEHIYEEIGNYASDSATNQLYSNKEINLTKPNDFSSLEKTVFTAVELINERNKITQLAAQTFAPPKSFISRLASSIWNTLFSAKNESEIVPPAELVARAMRTNIGGICHALNKQIANGKVDGIFRQSPDSATYNKNNAAQLVKVFNSDECYSDPIASAWMVKYYIAENLPKITIEEFNDSKNQDEFNGLLDNKINQINCERTRENIQVCFSTIAKAVNLAEQLKTNNAEIKLTQASIFGSMLTAFIEKSTDPLAELNFMKDKQNQFSNMMAKYVVNNDK